MNAAQLQTLADRLLAGHPQVDAHPDVVRELLQSCSFRTLRQGETLCQEGDRANELFILLTGEMTVSKLDLDGNINMIGRVLAPSLLGQMGIVDRSRRTATCTAAHHTEVAVMDQATFSVQVRGTDAPGVVLRRLLLSSLTQQLVQGNTRLRSLLDQANAIAPDAIPPTEAFSDELIPSAGLLVAGMRADGDDEA